MAVEKFTMPAEWAPQEAVWFAWPGMPGWWPSCRDEAFAQFSAMLVKISSATPVNLLCAKSYRKEAVRHLLGAGADLAMFTFLEYRTDDVWCRDFGPIFVKGDQGSMKIVDWGFNAWGGKFPRFKRDDAAPQAIAQALGLKCEIPGVILEGGGIEVNGEGVCITTESVLLNANRHPGMTKKKLETLMKKHLGISDVIWLKDGLKNDDTDGHIDNLTRFCGPRTVLTAVAPKGNPNYEQLSANKKVLSDWRGADGKGLEILDLPIPEEMFKDGEIMPASYANFLITNQLVLVPLYGQKKSDAAALKVIQKAFPKHRVEGALCTAILHEGGAIHCLSQQQPV